MHLCICVSEEEGDGEMGCDIRFTCHSTCVGEEGGDGEIQSRPKILEVLYFATACTILSPTPQCITVGYRKNNGLTGVRRSRSCRMVHHSNTGWNLLMTGFDLLDGGTGTSVVSQWSESGQGILGAERR